MVEIQTQEFGSRFNTEKGFKSCVDPVVHGHSLEWGIIDDGSSAIYALNAIDVPSFGPAAKLFIHTADTAGMVIDRMTLIRNVNNISITYDGFGTPIAAEIFDNGHLIERRSGFGISIATQQILPLPGKGDKYEESEDWHSIIGEDGKPKVVLSADWKMGKLLVTSDDWGFHNWQVNMIPLELQEQIKFSPKSWGNPDLSQIYFDALLKIASARIQPRLGT